MNTQETKWLQGKVVLAGDMARLENILPNFTVAQLIRDTDYALLQMLGKIARRSNFSNWPYPGGSHA